MQRAGGIDERIVRAGRVELEAKGTERSDGTVGPRDEARVAPHQCLDAVAPGADDELGDPIGVRPEVAVQRRPPLILMVVAGQHDVDPGVGEHLPDLVELGRVTLRTCTDHGMVEIRDRAIGAIRCQVVDEPLVLRGPGCRLVELRRRVEGHDVPAMGVEAVVVGDVVPIVEVAGGDTVLVLVVADDGVGDAVQCVPPRAVVAIPVVELGDRALGIDVTQVCEEIRIPALQERDDRIRLGSAACAVTGRCKHEGSAIGWRRAGPDGEGVRIDRRFGDAVGEMECDPHQGSDHPVAHRRFGRKDMGAIDERRRGQHEGVRRGDVLEEEIAVEIGVHPLNGRTEADDVDADRNRHGTDCGRVVARGVDADREARSFAHTR